MTHEILDDFNSLFAHCVFDKKLGEKVEEFHIKFINYNDEHISFFGGKLIGNNVVRFTNSLLHQYYDIFGISESQIVETIKHISSIDKSRIVTSDPFNVASMYLAHAFLTSPKLKPKDQIEYATLICLILNYRFMTGFMNRFFQYPIDQQMAQALYANLSYKFLIKKLANWEEVFKYRAVSMVHEGQLHHETLKAFNDDEKILKAIADAQGRMKDMIKNIYKEFILVHRSGQRIYLNNDTIINEEGMEILRDKNIGIERYKDYILNVVKDTNTFIKNELVDLIANLMENVDKKQFIQVLEWITKQSFSKEEELIDDFITRNLTFSFDYINTNQSILHHSKDIGVFLSTLRGAYMSSRSTDNNLLQLRKDGEKIVRASLDTTNQALIVTIRTSLLLYIVLRTYTKSYYVT